MLIGSTNDACLALAEHIAGSGEQFVQRMNALAKRLKMDFAMIFGDQTTFAESLSEERLLLDGTLAGSSRQYSLGDLPCSFYAHR